MTNYAKGSFTLSKFVRENVSNIAFLTCLSHIGQRDTDRVISIGQGK